MSTRTQRITCPGFSEEKNDVCGEDISNFLKKKFCPECAWPIDKRLWDPGSVACNGKIADGKLCANILVSGEESCSVCKKARTETILSITEKEPGTHIGDKDITSRISSNTENSYDDTYDVIRTEDVEGLSGASDDEESDEENTGNKSTVYVTFKAVCLSKYQKVFLKIADEKIPGNNEEGIKTDLKRTPGSKNGKHQIIECRVPFLYSKPFKRQICFQVAENNGSTKKERLRNNQVTRICTIRGEASYYCGFVNSEVMNFPTMVSSEIRKSVTKLFPYSAWKKDLPKKDFLKELKSLESGLIETYVQQAVFKDEVVDYLKQAMETVLNKKIWKETEQFQCNFMHGVLILYTASKYKVTLSEKIKVKICKLLLVDMKKTSYQKMKEEYMEQLPEIYVALTDFLQNWKKGEEPEWLCCLPLFHLLCGKSEVMDSGQAMDVQRLFSWCTDGIDKTMKKSQACQEWNCSPSVMLDILHPLFDVDPLLPWSFVAALSLKQMKDLMDSELALKIPLEVLTGYYFLKILNPETRPWLQSTEKSRLFKGLACLESVIMGQQTQLYQEKSCKEVQSLLHGSSIAEETLYYVITKDSTNRFLIRKVFCIFIQFLDAMETLETKKNVTEDTLLSGNSHTLERLNITLDTLFSWITRYIEIEKIKVTDIFKLLEYVITKREDITNDEIREIYTTGIRKRLNSVFQAFKGMEEELVDTYFEETFDTSIQAALTSKILEVADRNIECILSRKKHWTPKKDGNKKLEDILLMLLDKDWPEQQDTTKRMEFILSWKHFQTYLRLVCSGDLIEERIKICVKDTNKMKRLILSGEIKRSEFQLIQRYQNRFLEHLFYLHEEMDSNIFECRKTEIRQAEEVLKSLNVLEEFCYPFDVDLEDIHGWLNMAQKSDWKICELCNPCTPETIKSCPAEFNYFVELRLSLSKEFYKMLEVLKSRSNEILFKNIWTSIGKKQSSMLSQCQHNGKVMQADDIVRSVFDPTVKKWEEKRKRIIDGEISFKEVFDLFGEMKKKEMIAEFKHLKEGLPAEEIEKLDIRLGQVFSFQAMEDCLIGAELVLQFVDTYGIKGDFEPVQIISAMERNNCMKLKEFEEGFLITCEVLRTITSDHRNCLEEYINCKGLIDWIKGNITSVRNLKVFVELASLAAGEGDMEKTKCSTLHDALFGFAPLIFEIDENCDYKLFLEKFQTVTKNFESDTKLPEKLRDTSRLLDWLKNVHQTQGSLQMTSMRQIDFINASGIYIIDLSQEDDGNIKMKTDDILRLHFFEGEGEKQMSRKFTFSDLQELKSKIMLIAGSQNRGKTDIDYFLTVFDSVERLADVLNELISTGCTLFVNLHARFRCDKERRECVTLRFGEGVNTFEVKSNNDHKSEFSEYISELATFFEKCAEDWKRHVENIRQKYSELNLFTIEQIVILQRLLVMLDNDAYVVAMPILSRVKTDCSKADVVSAMKNVDDRIKKLRNALPEEEDGCTANCNEITLEVENFIEHLVSCGFSRDLALLAIAEGIKPENVQEGFEWCQENEVTLSIPQIDEENQDMENDYMTWKSTNVSGEKMMLRIKDSRSGSSASMKTELMDIWKEFLLSISSRNVSDFLSVEHLGMILQNLARSETRCTKRSFQWCTEGEPNLILCPKEGSINTFLSIYCIDSDQELPCADEVLLCQKNTRFDEIDIFWRRSILQSSGKVYCLLNAENLDHETSEKATKKLQEYSQKAKEREIQFRMVAICSSEMESNSRLVAALLKYQRPFLALPIGTLQLYIKRKMTTCFTSATESSSVVDKEGCTVRVVQSQRAGMGKSLFKTRMSELLTEKTASIIRCKPAVISIPFHGNSIDIDSVLSILKKHILPPEKIEPRIIHFDFSNEFFRDIHNFLLQLLILGSIRDSLGYVWNKSPRDMYIIEITAATSKSHHVSPLCLDLFPSIRCLSPMKCLYMLHAQEKITDPGLFSFDEKEFKSDAFQKAYNGIKELKDLKSETSMTDCLETLLKYCGLPDPSWAELKYFVLFLYTQILDLEQSIFCQPLTRSILPGLQKFVLKCILQMSKDFATRSLIISDESDKSDGQYDNQSYTQLKDFQIKRTWESSNHPYLFFNPDHNTMTFLGFTIENGNLIDRQTGKIEREVMKEELYYALRQNRVNLNESVDELSREQKIAKLCMIMGIQTQRDPDETYELTSDNVKKMLAIYMRIRCGIPVIIMGETGCGKTRLIKFLSELQNTYGQQCQPMVIMKVHGGTTKVDIKCKVKAAEKLAEENRRIDENIFTVLFFDEANTTDAFGIIKEIMCDGTMDGERVNCTNNLKFIAACNPYRMHSDEFIEKLENAGLGYNVDAENTDERFGTVPLRRLVYRVHPLPGSMLPLVWDFGQLSSESEELYIRQMVLRFMNEKQYPSRDVLVPIVSKILSSSQNFMRSQKNECSFVSLRNVERTLEVMNWFYSQKTEINGIFSKNDSEVASDSCTPAEINKGNVSLTTIFRSWMNVKKQLQTEKEKEEKKKEREKSIDALRDSLVLALGVCYHSSLIDRKKYRDEIKQYFLHPISLARGSEEIKQVLDDCQTTLLKNIRIDKHIAKNQALKENVFMMIICIELRIPLFLVGKPGSSKSLAKTVVSDAMQGNSSYSDIFKRFKQIQMVSFQCSPISDHLGILSVFKECARYQKDKNLDEFVAVVVLDEVGLAEDSPKMPLKALHPLLEDGDIFGNDSDKYNKVGFIGLSNWALDPAKMNRGIFVQREDPNLKELIKTAKGICASHTKIKQNMSKFIKPLAASYLEVTRTEKEKRKREFFGLRDFYSLIKMLCGYATKSPPTWMMLQHSIKRNFGGFDNNGINTEQIFNKNLKEIKGMAESQISSDDPDCTSIGLIEACLSDTSNSRYMLLITESYGALEILKQRFETLRESVTIFGSSFPGDRKYTQICRNINRIKVCMETGKTVVLLNLENLYESLYDALNQYYVYFGSERFVDLGLGMHRFKCKVHKDFRLIVVAETNTVYTKFPIPLINRLEKHVLKISALLTSSQLDLAKQINKWTKNFVTLQMAQRYRNQMNAFKVEEVFLGFHEDTCSSIVLHLQQQTFPKTISKTKVKVVRNVAKETCLYNRKANNAETQCLQAQTNIDRSLQPVNEETIIMETAVIESVGSDFDPADERTVYTETRKNTEEMIAQGKKILLKCATPDGVMRLRSTELSSEANIIQKMYFEQQPLESLNEFLSSRLNSTENRLILCQATTHSKLLSTVEEKDMCETLKLSENDVKILNLVSFDTEHQFNKNVGYHLSKPKTGRSKLLIVQCDRGNENGDLISCARYSIMDRIIEIGKEKLAETIILLIVQISRLSRKHFSGFQCGQWEAIHIDDLRKLENNMPTMADMASQSISSLLEHALHSDQNVKRHIDIKCFIKICASSAFGRIKDRKQDCERSAKRISLFHTLLNSLHNENKAFFSGVGIHLLHLMREKEGRSNISSSECTWLSGEATSRVVVNKSGTFRKACIQCMVEKISPLLASLIAYIDQNRNMDILFSKCTIKTELWNKVINNVEATNIKYSMFLSPKKQESSEVYVNGTAASDIIFPGKMPFSWILFNFIENSLKAYHSTINLGENVEILRVVKVLDGMEFCRILRECLMQDENMIYDYMNDFLYMIHPFSIDKEHEILKDRFLKEFSVHDKYETIPMGKVIYMHILYGILSSEFQNFSGIVQVWPDCLTEMLELQQCPESADFLFLRGKPLDKQGLFLLLKNFVVSTKALLSAKDINQKKEWLARFFKIRPAVEKIFQKCKPKEEALRSVLYWWNCIKTMKLLVENASFKDEVINKRCMGLWVILTNKNKNNNDENVCRIMEDTERFLSNCKKELIRNLFQIQSCGGCNNQMTTLPVYLPCSHFVCEGCFREIILDERKCRICQQPIPDEYEPGTMDDDSMKIDKYHNFEKCSNTFYMTFISEVCLARKSKPSDDLVNKLLRHVVQHREEDEKEIKISKSLVVFDKGIDRTFQMRYFLLHNLILACETGVKKYLKNYLAESKLIERKEDTELGILLISCFEDSYYRQTSGREEEITLATSMLNRNMQCKATKLEYIDMIEYIAESRYGLVVTAKCLHETLKNKHESFEYSVLNLLRTAFQFCQNANSDLPKYFVVKVLCRSFGIHCYNDLNESKQEDVKQFRLSNFSGKMLTECPDRFIVCGNNYLTIRGKVLNSARVGGQTIEDLQQILTQSRMKDLTVRHIYLAAVREITMKNIFIESDREQFTKTRLVHLAEAFKNERLYKEDFLSNIIFNKAWTNNSLMTVKKDMDLRTQSTVCLLYHFFIAVIPSQFSEEILSLFLWLIWKPEMMKDAYLPGMPEDVFSGIKDILQSDFGGAIYRCPNGHVYMIGDCGRPTVTSKCRDCGAEIGGKSYKSSPGNIRFESTESILQGHTLGVADPNHVVPSPARFLDAIECTTVRLLIHAAMYLSCSISREKLQNTMAIIRMQLGEEEMLNFLWEHIQVDIDALQIAFERNIDDIFLYMHKICDELMTGCNRTEMDEIFLQRFFVGGRRNAFRIQQLIDRRAMREFGYFRDPDTRNVWEMAFSEKFLRPTLKNLSNKLAILNLSLAKDERIGSDKFQRMLFEVEDTNEGETIKTSTQLQERPEIWKYRPQTKLCDLFQELLGNVPKDSNKILRLFLVEEPYLKAVRFVPSILKLQRILIRTYQRKLSRSEAAEMTIKQAIEECSSKEDSCDLKLLLTEFKQAWECVRTDLQTFLCPTLDGAKNVPQCLCQAAISEETNLNVLLPNFYGNGICSFALLFYLLQKQNNFLNECCSEDSERFSNLPTIAVTDVLESHLISYDHERDFLPMVHATCNFGFKGKENFGNDYNVDDLERQIIDRFLAYKGIISVSFHEIELMTYRYEGTNALVFTELRQKIPQERLKPETVKLICDEFKDYTEICDAISKIDIAICFLKSVGEKPETGISKFLSETLKMEKENPLETKSISSTRGCKHIQSLWMILSCEKTKQQLSQSRELVFQNVKDDLKKEVNDTEKKMIYELCTKLTKDQLEIILWILYECIELTILMQWDVDDEIDIGNIRLKENLIGFMDAPPYNEAPTYPRWVTDVLQEIPQEVLSNQAISLWRAIYAQLNSMIQI